MSTHNIQFHDKIRKKIPDFLFSRAIGRIPLGLENEFQLATVNEPSGFELLRFNLYDSIHYENTPIQMY